MRELYMAGELGNMWPTWYLPEFEQLLDQREIQTSERIPTECGPFVNEDGSLMDADVYMYREIPFCLMYSNKPGIVLPHYTEPAGAVQTLKWGKEWVEGLGKDPDLITVNETDHGRFRRLLNAEVCLDPDSLRPGGEGDGRSNWLSLYYSTLDTNMRPALKDGGRYAFRLEAKLIMQHFMDETSYEWVWYLMTKRFPGCVVEFTCYERCVGMLRRNTIVWECRHY
jgi:hypothetical protein